MADSKYGRLFTESEVRGLIVSAASDALRGVAETLRPDQYAARLIEEMATPTFPPDEPLFLLRASDGEQACDAVAQYGRSLSSSTREDVDRMAEHVRVANAWDAMRMWRPARG